MTTPGRRIAYLTYGSGLYDARMLRMARTALAAGYAVTVYARWYPGLATTEVWAGLRIVRAPYDWRFAVPGLRAGARRRAAAALAAAAAQPPGAPLATAPTRPLPRRAASALLGPAWDAGRRWWRIVKKFPLFGLGWAAALDAMAEPADLWHGMWAGSLPALARMARRFGGRTVYDSRDVYMQSRDLATAGWPGKAILAWLERRWAQAVDRVITVNGWYAGLLATQLGIERPLVVRNVPRRWLEAGRPNLIRDALGVPAGTAVVLYQGGLMTGRGIEQAMEAVLEVPDAVLCLLGFGALRERLLEQTAGPPYRGRVFVLDPVPPDDLLGWTASADVSVMAIQPTSVNHAYTTPQKLYESIAVGVPVVAAEFPAMAEVVRAADAGVLCDPTDPAAIAAAIRGLLEVPAAASAARRQRILQVARDRYAWEAEEQILLDLYADLLADPGAQAGGPASRIDR